MRRIVILKLSDPEIVRQKLCCEEEEPLWGPLDPRAHTIAQGLESGKRGRLYLNEELKVQDDVPTEIELKKGWALSRA